MEGERPTQNASDYDKKSQENAKKYTVNQFNRTYSGADKAPHLNLKKTSFLKKHWIGFTLISAACLLTAGFVYVMLNKINFSSSDNSITIPSKKTAEVKHYSKLSHIEVPDAESTNKAVTAVMIENSPNARPQSGLKDAEIVFESVAEGGITRFLALYQVNKPQLIGPVRSVREYYIDWATPFQPSIAHVGGSAAALAIIRNGSYRDIDQFFNANYYWRSSDRYAPHNVYTSFEKLDALNATKGYTTSNVESFARQLPKVDPNAKATATTISLAISSQLYNVAYNYNPETNIYARSLAGQPHLDREKGQITANAVIAIQTTSSAVPNDKRTRIDSLGSGKAYVFQNGQVTEGSWKKASASQQIRFYDSNNQEIAINAGQVWITAVPTAAGSVSWQ